MATQGQDQPRSVRRPGVRHLCHAPQMERGADSWWDHLVDVLATVGEVADRDPKGLVVTLDREDGSTQVVEVCLSPADWDDMTSIIGWHRESGALHVRDLVLKQPREYRLLIYRDYMLMPGVVDRERPGS